MHTQKHDAQIKVITIGSQNVGKSSLLKRYQSDDLFNEKYRATVGVDLMTRMRDMDNGKCVKVQLYDTAGQEKFRAIVGSYFKGAHGVVLVYDITNKQSFADVKSWYEDVKQQCQQNVTVMLVGNKIDLAEERAVTTLEGQQLAESLGMYFMETSAKENKNVLDAFDAVVKEIYDKELALRAQKANSSTTLTAPGSLSAFSGSSGHDKQFDVIGKVGSGSTIGDITIRGSGSFEAEYKKNKSRCC